MSNPVRCSQSARLPLRAHDVERAIEEEILATTAKADGVPPDT
jgi:hypothetical protein